LGRIQPETPLARKRKKEKGRGSKSERDGVASAPAEGSGVDEIIELDGDFDDPDARAALIAAAALERLVHDSASDADVEVQAGPTPSPSQDGPGDLEPGAGAAVDADAAMEASGGADSDVSGAAAAEAVSTPLIGPDALLALSQFRAEGVATLPEELVLDLGEATTPEQRDRLLAAALAHVEMQDAIYRVPLESGTSRRWKGALAALLFVMALFLAGLPPSFLVPDAQAPLTSSERVRGLRVALLVQAQQIEAFRAREGRLPSSLAEVETALPDVRFVKSNNRLYQLVAYSRTGDAVVFDSSAPAMGFAEAVPDWLAPGGR